MARMHLGSLGTPRPEVDADFDYFGETIRVHPDASDLDFAELMIVASGMDLGDVDPEDPSSWTPEQQAAMQQANDAAAKAIRGQVHPDDWELFFRTARKNRQHTFDLMALSQQISAAVAGFPTGQPSDSSAGRPPTRRKSKGASSAQRALKLLDGRPDLQEAVVQRYETRTG